MFGFLRKKAATEPAAEMPARSPDPAPVPASPEPREPAPTASASAAQPLPVVSPSGTDPAAPPPRDRGSVQPAVKSGTGRVPADDGMEIVVPPRHDPAAILADFEQEIDRQQDRLYGVALFFECVSLLHAGQAGVLDTNRKQFRNIIVAGHTAIGQARVLAAKARQDTSAIDEVRAFRFTFCEGHPNPIGLAARADALLNAFRKIHPDRPLDKPFTEEETYRLLEAASGIMSPVMDG